VFVIDMLGTTCCHVLYFTPSLTLILDDRLLISKSGSAGNIASSLSDLRSMLRSWNKNRDVVGNYLAYVLKESHADDLAHEDLEGKDRLIVDQLKSVARDSGFYICLAKLQCEIQGSAEDRGDEDDDCWDGEYDSESDGHHDMAYVDTRNFTLEKVFTLDGRDECVKPQFDKDFNLMQDDDLFDGQDPDSEEYEKYEGALTHYYRGSV
jgi:hypothetical protein